MKKILLLSLTAVSMMLMVACGGKEKTTSQETSLKETTSEKKLETPEETTGDKAKQSANAKITFSTQDYTNENIVEIPYIEYVGEKNLEIDSINRLINQGIGKKYEDFIANSDKGALIEIKSYPFTTEDYLQIVITSNVFPNYATRGDLFSVNYDKKANKVITVYDALAECGLAESNLTEEVSAFFVPSHTTEFVAEVIATGFLYNQGPNGRIIQLLLEVMIESSDSEPRKTFFSYTPETNEFFEMNETCLFDPYDMDQMTPPLSYQR